VNRPPSPLNMLLSRHTRRREFITLIGGAVVTWPAVGYAQPRAMPLVGVLCAGTAEALEHYLASFREGMWELGYVEGSNVLFEFRFADGYLGRLPDLANELVRLNPRVIVSTPLSAHLAARKATSTIPIVMATGADPVGFGLVASLSHPGGNVTGLANFAEMLASKQIDLLREMLPDLARLGLLVNVTNQLHVPQLRETKIAAEVLGIPLMPVEVGGPDQIEPAFATLGAERVEALLVPPDTTFYSRRQQIAELAATTHLPAIYGYREHVEVGGLMSYGPDIPDQYRRAAIYVDKILKGAQPAELPVEQPTKIELVINLKTAKALGLTVPPSLIARADAVIE
jgi:putative tryptophan/tyrosine transport system substrate-binding protein